MSDLPVSPDRFIDNIRTNHVRDLPALRRVAQSGETMLFAAAAPTLESYLPEIRSRPEKLFTSNKTHDYLIDNGIVPYAQMIIDPKPLMLDYVKHPHDDVVYFVGVQCDPGVFDALDGRKVVKVYACCDIPDAPEVRDEFIALAQEAKTAILVGGTMTPLRAMVMGEILGFRRIELYAFDSCLPSIDKHYAYDKERVEDILEASFPDGTTYLTTPVLANQARQYMKWKDRLDGLIECHVHGDNLTSYNERAWEREHGRAPMTGRWSETYAALQRDLHAKGSYGISGHYYVRQVSNLIKQLKKRYDAVSVLDYGCGTGLLKQGLDHDDVAEYDPFIAGKDAEPAPADLVVCTDVLEHIEPDALSHVLDHIKGLTKKLLYMSISCSPALKFLADGRNAHLIVRDPEWWLDRLEKRFRIAERSVLQSSEGTLLMVILQAKTIL